MVVRLTNTSTKKKKYKKVERYERLRVQKRNKYCDLDGKDCTIVLFIYFGVTAFEIMESTEQKMNCQFSGEGQCYRRTMTINIAQFTFKSRNLKPN